MNEFNMNNVDTKKILASLQEDSLQPCAKGRRKRQHLDEFTQEERIIRRKLKNRVAAQTARDRKRDEFTQMQSVVSQLQTENLELKKRNESLVQQVESLNRQNEDLSKMLGMCFTPPDSPVSSEESDLISIITTPAVPDHAHLISPVVTTTTEDVAVATVEDVAMDDKTNVIIKTEEVSNAGYASPTISLPQKARILLASLITLWLVSPQLNSFLLCLSSATQDRFVKSLLRRKLSLHPAQERVLKTSQLLNQLFHADLSPILRACLEKKLNNCPPAENLAPPSLPMAAVGA